MKWLLYLFLFAALLFAAFYGFNAYIYNQKQADESIYTFGTYAYRCGDGTEFSMSPSANLSSILLVPATSVERIPRTILSKVPAETGVRYEGNGIVFAGRGETVTLTTASYSSNCLPINLPDEAPFNFGD